MPDNRELEGGRKAFAGFLYQMVGTLGLRAWADRDHADATGGTHDQIIRLIRTGNVIHEHIQDAAIQTINRLGQGEMALAQFKFSEAPERNQVSTGDIQEIVEHLVRSTTRVEEDGGTVTSYFLITNRPTSAHVKQMEAARDADHDNRYFTEYGWIAADGTKTLSYAVFSKLQILREVPLQQYETELEEFALSLGCFDHEISDGLRHLVGDLIYRVVNREIQPVTKEDLIRAFTKYAQTKPITINKLAVCSTHDINRFREVGSNIGGSHLIYRAVVNEVLEALRRHYLVVVHGPGGCGKSSAVVSCLEEIASERVPGMTPIATIKRARDLRADSVIAEVVATWRGIPHDVWSAQPDSPDDAIKRLSQANPATLPPILHLGIDGCDEVDAQEVTVNTDSVRALLKWFWEKELQSEPGTPPTVALIVTCRDVGQLSDLMEVNLGYGAPMNLHSIPVTNFNTEELLAAAKVAGDHDLETALRAARPLRGGDATLLGSARRSQALIAPRPVKKLAPINEDILTALAQPAMWRALLELDSASRVRALEGDAAKVRDLAAKFVGWFCVKARLHGFRPRQPDQLEDALRIVATNCAEDVVHDQNTWITLIADGNVMYGPQATDFYYEAISSGLISEDARRRWRWRHAFVANYLCIPAPGREEVAP